LLHHYGFLGYISEVKNEEYLFPIINAGHAIKGKISHAFSKWYGRYLSSLGLTDKRLTFHSYRHSFKSFGRASGIEKSVLDAIQGHKGREVSLDYGKDEFGSVYPLKTLSEALEREALRDI
jgi:integrase